MTSVIVIFISFLSTAFDSVEEVTSATTTAVRALFTLREALLRASPFLATKVLSPVWLRSQSHFVRTMASELSLLLQVCSVVCCLFRNELYIEMLQTAAEPHFKATYQ